MITKHPEYWHLYFNEECPNDPAEILKKVEELFSEIAQMGDMAYFRIRPVIERERTFSSSTVTVARVFCRMSTPVPESPDPEVFSLFGLRRQMTSEEALLEAHRLLPGFSWHSMPVSPMSDSHPDRPTRCKFCLKFFELLGDPSK